MLLRIISICILLACPSAYAQPDEARAATTLFVTSDQCIACHSNLHTASGDDVSIGYDWRASMMANSARDPYWHAAVRREVLDHPSAQAAIEDKCATCHMPMARFDAATGGGRGEVFANLERGAPNALALDGVSCTVCHQISASNLGTHASFDGGFAIETATPLGERPIFGPHAIDGGRQGVMQSAALFVPSEATHLQRSELCATCHTLFTQSLNEAGEVVGELPEQVPYQEWLVSEYRETQSCQSCHMPEVAADTPIASVLGQPRPRLSQHTFRGANAFMLGVLNKHRTELGVTALSQELDGAIRETKAYLESAAAKVTIEAARRRGAQLEFDVVIASTTGHKLPTAYPSRRAWLHVTVRAADGRIVFESGAPRADGSIAGNDNDADALQFEPHYAEVRRADEVQIYESIMVDLAGRVTTGLLRGVRYAKDNRLLPRGFDKTTAPPEVAVHGAAAEDADFTAGGDRVRYRVDLPDERGALAVTVQLLYQSISYRWAQNLRAYEAAETQRFVAYYDGSAANSGLLLGSAAEVVPGR